MASELNIALSARAVTRVNLAVQHMLAAAHFSREVGRLERHHANQEFAEFWETIFHHSMASVASAVASLESYINELFSDRDSIFKTYDSELLADLWETYEKKRMVEKFEFALLLMKKPRLDRGAAPFQNVAILVDLRNALIHFKPEWSHEVDAHKKLSDRLNGKFAPGGFLPNDKFLFPRRWAGHSCTKWAVNSAMGFARAFEANAGLATKYKLADLSRFDP